MEEYIYVNIGYIAEWAKQNLRKHMWYENIYAFI